MEKKYLTISDVANITDIPSHTLRYWESEFKLLRPFRRKSGQRRYTQNDIDTIEKIKVLLYEKKYSIAGAKKQLIKEKKESATQMELILPVSKVSIEELRKIKIELLEIKKILSEDT